jgi:hypothetical protein
MPILARKSLRMYRAVQLKFDDLGRQSGGAKRVDGACVGLFDTASMRQREGAKGRERVLRAPR